MKRLLIALACAACAGLVSAQEAPKTAAPAPEAKATADSAAKQRYRRRNSMRRDARALRGREIETRPFGRGAAVGQARGRHGGEALPSREPRRTRPRRV